MGRAVAIAQDAHGTLQLAVDRQVTELRRIAAELGDAGRAEAELARLDNEVNS